MSSNRCEIIEKVLENEPAFRKRQIFDAIFKSKTLQYSQISNISLNLREKLAAETGSDDILTVKVADNTSSPQTTKWLFELSDKNRVETVQMQFEKGLASLCISSQVGCICNCSFCTTGKIGFKRDMSADEIVDQVLFFIKNGADVGNISFMGMGEPFLNPNLWQALTFLTSQTYLGMGDRRLSISTVGIPEGIKRVTKEFPQVRLVFSLHSPFDEERSSIVPMNRKYPLKVIMEALEEHILTNNKEISLAYLVRSGKNDTQQYAQMIKKLVAKHPRLYHINLLRYNGSEEEKFCTQETSLGRFKKLLENLNLHVTVRQSFGSNISAACGQLSASYL